MLEIPRVEGGLQTVGWLKPGVDAKNVARKAAERNIEVVPLSEFWRGGALRQGLQLGFGAVDPKEIRRGLTELRKILS